MSSLIIGDFEISAFVHEKFEIWLEIWAKHFNVHKDALKFIQLLVKISNRKHGLKFSITDQELVIFSEMSPTSKLSQSTLQRRRTRFYEFQEKIKKEFIRIQQTHNTVNGSTTYDLFELSNIIDLALTKVKLDLGESRTSDLLINEIIRKKFTEGLDLCISRLPEARDWRRNSAKGRCEQSKWT
jgi:hypothetical protein